MFLPGKSYGQRSLAGYGPWGRKESDTAERLTGHLTDEEVLFRMHKQLPESNERTRETGNLESYTNGQRRRKHRRPTVSERLRHTGHGQSGENHRETILPGHPRADANSPHPADRKDGNWGPRPSPVGAWGRREVW